MPQSSLMAWLNKPKAVTESPKEQQPRRDDTKTPDQLPTPPQSTSPRKEVQQQTPSFTQALRPLPPNVELRPCTKNDIPAFKRLIGLLLPIPYGDKFFREIIEDPLTNNITLLAVWHDDPTMAVKEKGRLVGAIRCRLLAHPPDTRSSTTRDEKPMLYLSTLALLGPYRSHGIASHMLQVLVKRAVDTYGASSVGAHVWEANEDGLAWYRKRGFRQVGREDGYYRRLDPQTAVVMQRQVGVMDLMRG